MGARGRRCAFPTARPERDAAPGLSLHRLREPSGELVHTSVEVLWIELEALLCLFPLSSIHGQHCLGSSLGLLSIVGRL